MVITVTCHICRKSFVARNKYLGKQVKCPNCESVTECDPDKTLPDPLAILEAEKKLHTEVEKAQKAKLKESAKKARNEKQRKESARRAAARVPPVVHAARSPGQAQPSVLRRKVGCLEILAYGTIGCLILVGIGRMVGEPSSGSQTRKPSRPSVSPEQEKKFRTGVAETMALNGVYGEVSDSSVNTIFVKVGYEWYDLSPGDKRKAASRLAGSIRGVRIWTLGQQESIGERWYVHIWDPGNKEVAKVRGDTLGVTVYK